MNKLKLKFNFKESIVNSVSMLDFRRDAEAVLAKVRDGERLILTHRGKPVARLEPIESVEPNSDDPFYALAGLAASEGPLTNGEIDGIIYGG